jgi:hypothetical protein
MLCIIRRHNYPYKLLQSLPLLEFHPKIMIYVDIFRHFEEPSPNG